MSCLPSALSAQIGIEPFTGLGPPARPKGDGKSSGDKTSDGNELKGGTLAEYAGPAKIGVDAATSDSIRRARELFKEEKWAQGLDEIDTLLNSEDGETLHTEDGILYVPLAIALKKLLFELPAAATDVYRTTYEPPARESLETALELPFRDSLVTLEGIARRFPMTVSAVKALESLGDRALDLGDPSRAASSYDEILWRRRRLSGQSANDRDEDEPVLMALRVKAALAHLLAGKEGVADGRLEQLREQYGDRVVTVGGEAIVVGTLPASGLVESLRESLRERLPKNFSPRSANGAARHRRSGQLPTLGSRAQWIHAFSDDLDDRKVRGRSFAPGSPIPRSTSEATFAFPANVAAVLPDRILVRSRRGLIALDVATGKLEWRADLEELRYDHQVFDDLGARTVSVVSGSSGDDLLALVIDAPGTPKFTRKGKPSFPANQIHAFDVVTGKRVWTVGGRDAYPTEFRTISFTAPPVEAGDGLLVASAARADGPLLVGLTSGGGVRWTQKLYEYQGDLLSPHRCRVGAGGPLAVSDGLAICARGDGVVIAVDVESGGTRWLSRYRALSAPEGGVVSKRQLAMQRVWEPTSPVIAGGVVILAPHDSALLLALDLESGESRWERDLSGDRLHFVGADRDLAFVTGSSTEAIATADGKTRYRKDTGFESAAARGFVADGRVFLPLKDEVVVLESGTGEIVSRLGFTDARLKGLKPGNLALVPTGTGEPGSKRLLALGKWGVALVEPQQRSWERVSQEEDAKKKTFGRIQLLRAERRYEEVFGELEAVLADPKDESVLNPVTQLLIATAREVAVRRNDSEAIARILRNSTLALDDATRSSLRLELARRLEPLDPARAASLYLEVIRDLRGKDNVDSVRTPDGVTVRPDRYAAASLRLLVLSGHVEAPKEENERALEVLREMDGDRSESSGASRASLRRIAFESPYLEASNEALARLAHMAATEGNLAATARLIERLSAHPELRKDPRIDGLRAQYSGVLDDRKSFPAGIADLIAPDIKWKQRFWKKASQGVLVESLDGSHALDHVFSLKGGRISAFSPRNGTRRGEVSLPDFPNIEDVKSQLRSHLEEPAMILQRGDDATLFSAAGVYQLVWEGPRPHDGPPGVGWRHTYPHPLAEIPRNRRSGSAANFVSKIHGNAFPRFFLTQDRNQGLVLRTDGELFSVDMRTGKIRYRVKGVERSPFGDATIVGTDLVTATVQPSGLLGYSLVGAGDQQRSKADGIGFAYQLSGNAFRSVLVPDIAVVVDTTDGVRVTDPTTRQTLWRLVVSRDTPALARVTGSEVWVVEPEGFLRAHALRGGRAIWSVPIPRHTTALRAYPFNGDSGGDIGSERGAWVVLAIDGAAPSSGRHKRIDRSGASLCLVKVTDDGQKLEEVEIGKNGVTFHNGCWMIGSHWLLAYNEREAGVWKSKVSGFDPASGALRVLFEAEVSADGTGRPPRLALIAGGENELPKIALGNSNGFGVFDASPHMEREVMVAEGAKWRFFRGVQEPSPNLEWTQLNFDDGNWEEGPSGFGYGDGDDATVLKDMQNSYTTVYVRHELEIPDPERFAKVLLSVRADDGFVAYVNGQEVGRLRVPGKAGIRLPFDATARNAPEPPPAEGLEIKKFITKGKNIVALQAVNGTLSSSDLSLIPVVIGEAAASAGKKSAKKDVRRVIDL